MLPDHLSSPVLTELMTYCSSSGWTYHLTDNFLLMYSEKFPQQSYKMCRI